LGNNPAVTVQWVTAFLDTPRGADVDAFWLEVTGTKLSSRRGANRQFATLLPPYGDAFLRVQVTESDTPGVHFDLHVPNPSETARHALSLNADIIRDHGTFVGLTSPGGMPFCLVPHRAEQLRPQPVAWSRGWQSLVDQVCIDIPANDFEREARFWAAMTGWSRRPGALPEFDYLVRPADMPIGLLLQRVGDAGAVRAHLDMACDDVPAETARHEALGATFVRRTSWWITLRDPAGRDYCITSRDPSSGRLTPPSRNR